MNIRKATIKDFNEILKLELEWEKEGISWGVKHPTRKQLSEHIKKDIVYVAEVEGRFAGHGIAKIRKAKEDEDWSGLRKGEKFGWIDGVYVRKKYRNKGIGRLLTKKLLDGLKKEKIKTAKLKAVSKELRRLVRFYEKFGFKEKMSDMVIRLR